MVDLVCRESKAEPGSSDSVLAYLHLESAAALPATGRVLGGGLLDLADSSWRRCRGFSYARASLVLQNFVALGFAVPLGCFPASLFKRGGGATSVRGERGLLVAAVSSEWRWPLEWCHRGHSLGCHRRKLCPR